MQLVFVAHRMFSEIVWRGIRNAMTFVSPGAEIDKAAAFTAKGPPGTVLTPFHGFFAGGTFHGFFLHGFLFVGP